MMVENDNFWGELRQLSNFRYQISGIRYLSSDGFCMSLISCLAPLRATAGRPQKDAQDAEQSEDSGVVGQTFLINHS